MNQSFVDAVCAFHRERDLGVWIPDVEFLEHAREVERLRVIEVDADRMMREGRAARG